MDTLLIKNILTRLLNKINEQGEAVANIDTNYVIDTLYDIEDSFDTAIKNKS